MVFQVGNRWGVGNRGGGGAVRHQRQITRALIEGLEQVTTVGPDRGRKQVDRLARAMIREAINGNVFAAKFITERVEGLPKQELDIVSNSLATTVNWNMSAAEASASYQAFIHELEFDSGNVIEATAVDDKQIEADRAELIKKALAKPRPEPPAKRMDENKRRRKERGLG
jgi:hypothetical protein